MRLLVTGGAGYIGSVVAAHLVRGRARRDGAGRPVHRARGRGPGRRPAGRRHPGRRRRRGAGRRPGVRRGAALRGDVAGRRVDGAPGALLGQQRRRHRWPCSTRCGPTAVRRLVFSSTAATYGEPERGPIPETAPTRPTNPYGASKLAVDHDDHVRGRGRTAWARSACATSTWPARPAAQGERHDPETHLIPIVLQVATGQRETLRGLRRRLPDPGRHLHPRLHPRRRPGRGAPAGAGRRPCRASTGSTTSATATASRCGR